MASKKLVVIDGKSVLYRGYYAMGNLATPDGKPTGATYGFAMMGLKILKEFDPDYVVVAWDKSKTNIRARRKLYEDYKAQRKPMPEDLREQLSDVRRLCEAFGWPLLEIDDFEADDIMGTLAVQAKEKGIDSVLVTSDLDVLQLVNHHTQVCALKRGLTQTVLYDQEQLKKEFGMDPSQFVDYKSLRGDPSDNIPGVKGVGDKTAKNLIQEYGSLENVYENLDNISTSVAKKLTADKDMAFLSRDLIKLSLEVPVQFDDIAADVGVTKPEQIDSLFNELSFHRLRSDLPDNMKVQEQTLFTGVDEARDINTEQENIAVIHNEVPDLDAKECVVFVLNKKVIISTGKQKAHVVSADDITESLNIIGHHTKEDLKSLPDESKVNFDVMIAAFLLNPLLRQQELTDLAREELNIHADALERSDELGEESIQIIVYALWQLHEKYSEQLAQLPRLEQVAQNIEWPLLPVLAGMERYGVKLDVNYLRKMNDDFTERINQLEDQIYEEAGQEFNINSPQQLQTILFDKLQLSTDGIKKTKTGYSTGASELDKLRGLHPIINLITHYRELTKLKSTYIEALPKLVDENNRLHTTFTQTVAQTGRLSSLHPNLQNIPVRTEEGRAIRTAFITEEGNSLIQADYSQIELRLAAVLSKDEKMVQAFNSGADIHTQTAAELYGITSEEVTKQQRYSAKTVNFGVLYGMSPHGLSVATGMSREEAKDFIQKYFDLRQGLLEYLDSLKQKAKADGYVETLFGRRRPMPDIHSSNFAVRSAAERAAMNMPIQGTAADLMKMAMIEADKKLESNYWQILQVHDAILVEAPEEKAEDVAALLKETMEGVYELEVKLDVETSVGKHWGGL